MGKTETKSPKEWALEQAIQRRIERDRGWRVLVRGRDWLCPFCGEVGVSPFRESRGPHDILRHLLRECPAWSEIAGTRFSHTALEEKARCLDVQESLRADLAWQVRDTLGRWYCPYCVEPTFVDWPTPSQDGPPSEAVLRHLAACSPYRDGRKPRSDDALRLVAQDADRHRTLTAETRLLMESDSAWRQATSDGKWVCPQCHQPVPEVDLSSDLLVASLAPSRMARHLMERCTEQTAGGSQQEAETRNPEPETRRQEADTEAETKDQDAEGAPPEAEKRPIEAPPSHRSLQRAREIVLKMLPAEVPRIEGYDLYCLYRPTESVGGDFFDYARLSDAEIAFLIGDVSGHGLEAALIMTMVKKSLKLHGQQHRSPAEVFRGTNDDIMADLDARTFVTATYAVLDARRGLLTYARAGHNLPLYFNPRRKQPVRHLESKGIALGLYRGGLFDRTMQETELRLAPGDVFVLYTDGVVEARNPTDEAYGLERLEAAVARSHGDFSAQDLANFLFDDVRRFAAGAPQDDDIAILCLTVGG